MIGNVGKKQKIYLRFSDNGDSELNLKQERNKKRKMTDHTDGYDDPPILSLALTLGLSISLPIVGAALVGNYLVTRYNISSKVTAILIAIGSVIGISNLIIIIIKSNKK